MGSSFVMGVGGKKRKGEVSKVARSLRSVSPSSPAPFWAVNSTLFFLLIAVGGFKVLGWGRR